VLVTFNAPLGVPESYLAAAARVQSRHLPKTFLELLACACSTPDFFDATRIADGSKWSFRTSLGDLRSRSRRQTHANISEGPAGCRANGLPGLSRRVAWPTPKVNWTASDDPGILEEVADKEPS
jgi:hypothetical protein